LRKYITNLLKKQISDRIINKRKTAHKLLFNWPVCVINPENYCPPNRCG
jgi:hypothetical protein